MTLCIFTLENNKYYIKKYQQDLIDSIKNMVDKLNNEELFLTNLKLTFQNNEWIIKNPIISYKLIDSDKIEELTIKFMKEYGIQSTRSDLYPAVNLKLDETEYLKGKITIGICGLNYKENTNLAEKSPGEQLFKYYKKNNLFILKLLLFSIILLLFSIIF